MTDAAKAFAGLLVVVGGAALALFCLTDDEKESPSGEPDKSATPVAIAPQAPVPVPEPIGEPAAP